MAEPAPSRRVLHPEDATEVAEYVQSRGYKRVALQVPDGRLLRDAPLLAAEVRAALAEGRRQRRRRRQEQDEAAAGGQTGAEKEEDEEEEEELFILADTSANPLAVDEVAAAHAPSDCVVHFGPASLTRTSRTPALCVLPRRRLPPVEARAGAGEDIDGNADNDDDGARAEALGRLIARQLREEAEEAGDSSSPLRAAVVLLDQGYVHALPRVERAALEALGLLPSGSASAAASPLVPWPVAFARPLPRVLDPEEGAPECLSLRAAVVDGQGQEANSTQEGAAGGAPTATAAGGGEATMSTMMTGAGLQWSNPGGASRSETLFLWVGPLVDGDNDAADAGGSDDDDEEQQDARDEAAALAAAGPAAAPLARLQLVYSDAPWRAVDPRRGVSSDLRVERGPSRTCQLLRRRRRFAVSAAHGSAMVGVLVGTLGAAGFREAVAAVRALAVAAGKRPYTLLVGKPNPAKLANFPELGCFVHVTDPEGALLLAAQAAGGGGGDFLAPVVTPHEAAVAFGAAARGLDAHDAVALLESRPYSLGFDTVVREAAEVVGGEGAQEGGGGSALVAGGSGSGALAPVQAAGDILARAERAGGAQALQPATAAEFLLLRRGYRGLETPASTGAPTKAPALATEGRLGRAAGYEDEGE